MRNLQKERRHQVDLLQRSFLWLGFISWGLFWCSILVFNYARPEVNYGLVRYWDLDIRTTWDPEKLQIFLYALWSCFAITLFSVALILPRSRRINDNQIYYFEFLLIIALVSLVAFYI